MNRRQAKKKKTKELNSLYILRPIASVPRWRMMLKWESLETRWWRVNEHKLMADPHIMYEVR